MGQYELPDGRKVSYTDGSTIRDVADLLAVLPGEFEGTPSTTSDTLKAMVADLQAGKPLANDQWLVLKRLLAKHGSALAQFRAGSHNDEEGFVPLPPEGTGRISEALRLVEPRVLRWLREDAGAAPTGAMVALYPSEEVAGNLAQEGGESADELHLTLAFLGDASMLGDTDKLRNAVGKWAAATPPLTGQVSGTGLFTAGPQPVTYASADVPALPAARQDLVERLVSAGCPPSQQHGFTPHVTLAYGEQEADLENLPLTFDHASLVLGGERWDFPLTGLPPGGPRRFSEADIRALAR